MAVKITNTGIDTVQDNTISASKIVDNSISPEDMPSFVPIQVVRNYSTSRGSYVTGTSDTVVPNMGVTIIPKLSGSRFLIMVRWVGEIDTSWDCVWNIQKNGTRINVAGSTWNQRGLSQAKQTYNGGADNNSTPEVLTFKTWDDTGSTKGTPITFRMVNSSGANRTTYYNGDWAINDEFTSSEIIVMEFKG